MRGGDAWEVSERVSVRVCKVELDKAEVELVQLQRLLQV